MMPDYRVAPEADNHGRPGVRRRCDGVAFVAGCLPARFRTPIRIAAELQPNLVAYRDRMLGRYYPELVPAKVQAA